MNNSCAKTTLNPVRPYYSPTLDYYKVVADRSSHINLDLIFSISSSHYSTCVHTMRGGEVGSEGGMECNVFLLFQLMLYNIWNRVFVVSKLIVVIFFSVYFPKTFVYLQFEFELFLYLRLNQKNIQFISNQHPFSFSFVIGDNIRLFFFL